jgi:hypothetical protein
LHLVCEPAGGGGEDGDENAEAEGAAELMGDVHEAGGGAGVFGCDAGDAGSTIIR